MLAINDPAWNAASGKWTRFDGPAVKQPTNRAETISMLGDPTGGGKYTETEKPDPIWVKNVILETHGTGNKDHRLDALHPSVVKHYCKVHRIVEPYMREAFRRAELACPGYIKVVSGPLVFRHMRHDPKLPLSNHAWGGAVDINPDDNGGKYAKDHGGHLPVPWTQEWWKLYPKGMPEAVVRAFESCGFRWGGWWTDYTDPMHLEWISGNGDPFAV